MTINSKTQVELLIDGRKYSTLLQVLMEKYEKTLPYDDMAIYRMSVLKKEFNKLLILAKIEEINQAILLCEENNCSSTHGDLEIRRRVLQAELGAVAKGEPEAEEPNILVVKVPT